VTDRFDCVIPAAGEARRMGRAKQLAELEGHTLLERAVARALRLSARVIVVTGAHREAVEAEVDRIRSAYPDADGRLIASHNPEWHRGMLGSILVGGRRVRTAWFFVAPVDMPDLPEHAFHAVAARAAAYERGNAKGSGRLIPRAIFPIAEGRRGHPVLIHRSMVAMVEDIVRANHHGALPAMRDLLRDVPTDEEPVDDVHRGMFIDLDTPEELASRRHLGVLSWSG
jgi:CTP:molybdopterin cytidylyltransferase MocA